MTSVLLIKLGALGDVLRTTCLLAGIRKKWNDARVTWVVEKPAVPLLIRNTDIAQVVPVESMQRETAWDVLINLDEDPRATELARAVSAKQKLGIGRNRQGKLTALTAEAEHLVRLASDDRLKFRENQMPFQALIYQSIGLTWRGEPYTYVPPPDLTARQAKIFSEIPNPKRVGLFVGASERYANKFWSENEIAGFCAKFQAAEWQALPELLLFGGPSERARLFHLGSSESCRAIPRISIETLDDLAALVASCAILICGDTLAMHLGQALNVPTVVLFGPTAHVEIAGARVKIVSPYSCGPCYLRACDITPSCMSAIGPERVLRAARELLFFK